jgi:signal peptidase II
MNTKTAPAGPQGTIATTGLALLVAATLAVVVVDQVAKAAIRHTMSVCSAPPVRLCDHHGLIGPIGLLRTENADSAFGLFSGSWGLLALVVFALAIMAAQLKAVSPSRWLTVAIALQLGGLLANAADRLLYGVVTDFIDIRIGDADKGLVLNPADIGLAIGGLMFLIALDRRLGRAGDVWHPSFLSTCNAWFSR